MLKRFSLKLDRVRTAAAVHGLLFYATTALADVPREVDLSISGIALNNVQHAKAPWGNTPALDDPEGDRPTAYYCNADNTERLGLVYYEGDTAYIIGEFKLEQVNTPYVDCSPSPQPIAHFISGKGISLGMSREQVVGLLGHPHHQHPQLDEIVLIYRIDNKSESDFLQHHSAPAYFGQYHFKQEKLVKFGFGFEFP